MPRAFADPRGYTGLGRSPPPVLPHPAQVLTAVGGHLPLLVDQQQNEREAEDSHDAGACGQGCSQDVCKGKRQPMGGPIPAVPPKGN